MFKKILAPLLGVIASVILCTAALADYSPGGLAGLVVSGTSALTFIVTGVTSLTLPAVTDTVAVLGTNQTFSATETVSGTLAPTGTVATQGQTFKTVEAGNPLMLMTVQSIPVASVNAGYAFLSGVTGRTIYPGLGTITALGANAASGSGVTIKCTSGSILASVPAAELLASVGVPLLSVMGLGTAGCGSGDSIYVSTGATALTGALTYVINLPYTVQ